MSAAEGVELNALNHLIFQNHIKFNFKLPSLLQRFKQQTYKKKKENCCDDVIARLKIECLRCVCQ